MVQPISTLNQYKNRFTSLWRKAASFLQKNHTESYSDIK